MGESADAVVIGGGIIGVNVAFRLARRGLKKVVLLEKAAIAAGASGKGTAAVGNHFRNETKMRLASKALEIWTNFNDVYGVKEHYYQRRGQIWLGAAEHESSMRSVAQMQCALGINAHVLNEAELRELAPQVSLEDIAIATYDHDSGLVDAMAATSAVAEAARRAGADLRIGTAVRSIAVKNGHVEGVKTEAGSISSPLVFSAASAWSARLVKPLGVRITVRPTRTQLAMFRRPEDYGRVSPTVIDLVQRTHFSDHPGNLMLVGRMGPLDEDSAPDPDDYPENADWSVIRQFRDEVWRRIPIMRRSAFRGGYSGVNDLSPDSSPIVDRVPEADGLFVACGFSGAGFCFAPAVGQLIAEWALDGVPSIDLAKLSLDRFAEQGGESAISAKSAEPPSY